MRHARQHKRYMQYFSLNPVREGSGVQCLGIGLRFGVVLDEYAEECDCVD